MARLIGDGTIGSCLIGGADPPDCVATYAAVPCPEQAVEASGPLERLAGVTPCPEGEDC